MTKTFKEVNEWLEKMEEVETEINITTHKLHELEDKRKRILKKLNEVDGSAADQILNS